MSQKSDKRDRWARIWHVPSHDKTGAERHLAVLALGLVQALRQKRIDAHEAWDSGLNFETYLRLKEQRVDRRLLDLWTWAMELPQFEKLGPKALEETYEAIESYAAAVLSDHRKAASSPAVPGKRRRFAPKQIKNALEYGRR